MVSSVHKVLATVSGALTVASGWAILLYAVALSIEIVLRRSFAISIQGFDEYGGYLLAITSAIGFSYCLFMRSHIRVDVLLRLMPRPLRAWGDVLAAASLGFFGGAVLTSGFWVAYTSWRMQARAVSPIQTPLVLPQGLWIFAIFLFVLSCAVVALLTAKAALRKDWREAERLAAIPTPDEEVVEEVEAARRRGMTSEISHERGEP
jgi:TRAP-type C4-dicarboxylate transport system permease small subunit